MKNVQPVSNLFSGLTASIIIISSSLHAYASGDRFYEDLVYNENIRTVRMHVSGWEMSYPVIRLGSNERLHFSFDDLDGDVKSYQYRIIHCNADWTPSTLFPSDYMDGFFENNLDNFRYSFNTFVRYTHYSLEIPNHDVSLRIPGNYVIKVYKDFDESRTVLTRRFMVSQPQVDIAARVHRPHMTRYYDTGQQVTFSVRHPELRITDPRTELFVTVMQNGRQDNMTGPLQPMYVRDREIVYEHEEELVFPAGNEYRNFDTKSTRYLTEFIRSVEFSGGINHVELHPSPSRQYGRYFAHHDINGRFLIRNEEGRSPSYDADYLMVWFTLPWETPFDNGNVYVLGALSDWNFYPWNRMQYNFDTRAYELGMLLKQGYYNYKFVFREYGPGTADATLFEGNFFETENDYLIMVYHRPPGSRYDRLVGTMQINSRN
ncbi:MAG: DUF5103 domain-containing protein [Marinilabiliales bacterium]|nr:MAG: DUF5103 domain-containing protein [Marinilabiliales bacterium]